jgi:alginate O-acetyltransferase complex protein AlgI
LLFTSISYLLFLPLIVLAYYTCPARFRWVWLVLASIAYYLSFIPIFFALIGVLVIANYFGGRWLFKANEQGGGKQVLTIRYSVIISRSNGSTSGPSGIKSW